MEINEIIQFLNKLTGGVKVFTQSHTATMENFQKLCKISNNGNIKSRTKGSYLLHSFPP